MILILALTFAASAQATPDRPDFSGRWVLDSLPRASDHAIRLVVDQPVTSPLLRISIRREMPTGIREETRLIGVIGGTVGGVTKEGVRVGDSSRVETAWHGNSLVFVNLSHGPAGPRTGNWSERRESWSLEPDGRLRVEISTDSWDSSRTVAIFFYHRGGS